MSKLHAIGWIALATILTTVMTACGGSRTTAEPNIDNSGVAIDGYDVVSYHNGSPVVGTASHQTTWGGATYHFTSAENLAAFTADPARYAPAYGGWCAYAMADGDFVEVDPERFLITDGRLYLFYDGTWGDTLPLWQADAGQLQVRADQAWSALTPVATP